GCLHRLPLTVIVLAPAQGCPDGDLCRGLRGGWGGFEHIDKLRVRHTFCGRRSIALRGRGPWGDDRLLVNLQPEQEQPAVPDDRREGHVLALDLDLGPG